MAKSPILHHSNASTTPAKVTRDSSSQWYLQIPRNQIKSFLTETRAFSGKMCHSDLWFLKTSEEFWEFQRQMWRNRSFGIKSLCLSSTLTLRPANSCQALWKTRAHPVLTASTLQQSLLKLHFPLTPTAVIRTFSSQERSAAKSRRKSLLVRQWLREEGSFPNPRGSSKRKDEE